MKSKSNDASRIWDAAAAHWIDLVRNNKISSRVESTNDAIIETIISYHPKKLLDIGCGEGWLCGLAIQNNITYTGIDVSIQLIDAAKKSYPQGVFFHYSYDQLDDLEEEISGYDVAVFNFSIFQKDGLPEILTQISRFLNDNGVIIIHTLHPDNKAISSKNKMWIKEDWNGALEEANSFQWYFRSMQEWNQDIIDSGLKLIEVQDIYISQYDHPFSLIMTLKSKQSISS